MKRSFARVVPVLALCVGWALWASPPAFAKGPSQAVLEGPGISSPIAVRDPGDPSIGPELASLIKDSGLFIALCQTCEARLRQRPTAELGQRYVVTYTMGTRSDEIVQYLFPYAVPTPVTYVPAGQWFARQSTVGGWFIASPRLRRLLMSLGGAAEEAAAPPVDVLEPTQGRTSATLLLVTGAMVLSAALAVVLRKRSRKRAFDIGA
jgi:hypothetical protein